MNAQQASAASDRSATARRGISIRLLSMALIATAILAIALSVFELSQTTQHAQQLYELEQERILCDKAIQQFMDGSDRLTAQVQQFVIKGERSYMDSYWTEVNQIKSRDAALEMILGADLTAAEHDMALASKNESDSLIQGELWAMRMVSESIGLSPADMPSEVAACQLSPSDAALDAAQKQSAAIAYVFGPEYSTAKQAIRGNVTSFRNEIANRYGEETLAALAGTKETSTFMALCVVVFFLFTVFAILCFARQVVSPLVSYSRALTQYEEGKPISLRERGALEIRQFAGAFNALYAQVQQNEKRLARLGYIDFLTEVPNRASITEYVTEQIAGGVRPLGLLIVDIDNFKRFNDTYGHALGDKVLRHVAQAVCHVQPKDTGISGRICGEEFVVVARSASKGSLHKTADKILDNVRRITASDVGLEHIKDFHITVSIGGMLFYGDNTADIIGLLSKADQALYTSKNTGKDKYTFYE